MNKILCLILVGLLVSFAVISGAAGNKPAPTTKDALMARERSAYEAWKTRDAKFWEPFLSEKYVGFVATGRIDRTAAIKEYSGADCEVKSVLLSDDRMMPLGANASIVTFKTTIEASCGGHKLPTNSWAASVYVRSGDKWKGAFHAESPMVDPGTPPATPPPSAMKGEVKPAALDALTLALMAVENTSWESWKNRDIKGVEGVMAKDFLFLSSTGRTDKAEAIKGWVEPKCEGLQYSLTEPIAISLSSDAAFVTYKASVKGVCDGKPEPPSLWVVSVDLKEGENWRNAFFMDQPR